MNCVEVEITSPEEAFEVLFKGKTLNLLKKLSWEFDFDTQSKHQNINIFSLFDKKNRIDDIHCVNYILFHLFKKKTHYGLSMYESIHALLFFSSPQGKPVVLWWPFIELFIAEK